MCLGLNVHRSRWLYEDGRVLYKVITQSAARGHGPSLIVASETHGSETLVRLKPQLMAKGRRGMVGIPDTPGKL